MCIRDRLSSEQDKQTKKKEKYKQKKKANKHARKDEPDDLTGENSEFFVV